MELIGNRLDTKQKDYVHAQKATAIFLKQWDKNQQIKDFHSHLICTSEYAAREISSPYVFAACLFHHCKNRFIESVLAPAFSEERSILKSFHELDRKFKQIDMLITSYIHTKKNSPLERFKEETVKLVEILKNEKGIEALFVLLASKIHELETANFPEDWLNSLEEIVQRSLFFFVPCTHFLQLNKWTAFLEGYAFEYLDASPDFADHGLINLGDYNQYIPEIEKEIRGLLNRKNPIEIKDFSWRTKGIFSIWEKIKNTGTEPKDIIGFRIVVENKEDCYEARNRILSRYRIRSSKHDDYFITRNQNEYQAIHLGLSKMDLPKGCPPVEIQIRDWENHFCAEDGDLRHATYKLKNRKYLIENDNALAKIWEFWLNKWTGLLSSRTIIRMSDGAIVILHREPKILDLLHRIEKLRQNFRITATRNGYKLDQTKPLISGDIISIAEEKETQNAYNSTSFDFASHKNARQWLIDNIPANQNSSPVIDYGDELIKGIFRKKSASQGLQKVLLYGKDYNRLCEEAAKNGIEYADKKIFYEFYNNEKQKKKLLFDKIKNRLNNRMSSAIIESENSKIPFFYCYGKLYNFRQLGLCPNPKQEVSDLCAIALCCNPVPGDKLAGHVSSDGKAVRVHRADCFFGKTAWLKNSDRFWKYEWKDIEGKNYDAGLEIFSIKGYEFKEKIVSLFADYNINITKTMSLCLNKSHTMVDIFGLQIQTVKQITKVIKEIENIIGVITVQRSAHPDLLAWFLREYELPADDSLAASHIIN